MSKEAFCAFTGEKIAHFPYFHVAGPPPKPLGQQRQGVNDPLRLRWSPLDPRKRFPYPRAVEPRNIMPRPHPSCPRPPSTVRQKYHYKKPMISTNKEKIRDTVEDGEDLVGDLLEGGRRGHALRGDSVAADRGGGDGGEVGGAYKGGIAPHLHQPPRAHQDRPELQQRIPSPAPPPRHRRLHVEERDLLTSSSSASSLHL